MPEAVILDMDGLMLDTEAISRRVWREAAQDLGLVWTDEIAARLVGRPEAATRVLLEEHFNDGVAALLAHAQSRYRQALETEGVPKKAGLDDLLAWLRLHDVPRAVATSTARALAEYKLARAGIRGAFDVVVCGDEIACGKPAPDIFLHAAVRLGVEPGHCVVLEDSGPGIAAAAAAGMVPVLVPDSAEPAPETSALAAHVVGSLHEAARLLEQILRVPSLSRPAVN
ncbi:MAG: HAD family phosphatase [Acidobacteria bacterium]|nr:HAD family phosphatase [Acidobacteriota bacterium]